MTTIRNLKFELARFHRRVLVIGMVVVVAFLLVACRLVYLQVVRHEDLNEQAESNRTAIVPIVPNRGLILDRNGIVLANNYSAYTLEITPSKVADLEATIDAIGEVIPIEQRDRRRFKKLLEESKSFESLPIRTRLTDEEVARFAAQLYRFQGVEIKARLFRSYPYGELASHVIGYIGRINQAEKERIEENDDEGNYRGTDYIGKLGVEQSYEQQLHGITGVDQVETSAGGRAVRKLATSPPTAGDSVRLSIDIKLQKLVEDMFGERRGALVAIDPSNGEVLAFVSKPTFDPNLFVEGIDTENWQLLTESIDKPLLNRALRGTYPPGSTYKPFMALAALATGKRTAQQAISDPGYFMFGNHRFRDDKEGGHGLVDMYRSIVQSCDTYYYMLAADMGVDLIHDQLQPFGFGLPTGIDLNGEVKGTLPSTEWKRRMYKRSEQQRWYAGETISLGIGQGYNNFTVLQMAQATSILANGGMHYRPRLVHQIENPITHAARVLPSEVTGQIDIKPEHLEVIRRAMVGVNREGTGAGAFRGAAYVAAGKTGTAQVVAIKQNEKYSAAKTSEHLRDHALYIAFAPAEAPRIAIAVVVENAGFGAEHAAPITRRVFDYWLQGQYPNEEDMAAVKKGMATAPIGTPLLAADMAWPPKGSTSAIAIARGAGPAPAGTASSAPFVPASGPAPYRSQNPPAAQPRYPGAEPRVHGIAAPAATPSSAETRRSRFSESATTPPE